MADNCFGHFKLRFGVSGANNESDNFLWPSALLLTDLSVCASEEATHVKPMGRLIGCRSVGSVAKATTPANQYFPPPVFRVCRACHGSSSRVLLDDST